MQTNLDFDVASVKRSRTGNRYITFVKLNPTLADIANVEKQVKINTLRQATRAARTVDPDNPAIAEAEELLDELEAS